jgi:hypothetical protein
MQSRVSITLCHMCRLSPATTLMSALIAALCWNKDVLCRIRTGWGYDWLASSSERSSKFWRGISQQYSGVFCLRGYANWIHHKAWCGTTNANFVIKLSKQPKQHQIQWLIIPVLPFFPSDGTHGLTIRDICGHSTVYTVRQTQNSNEEQPWNRTAGRGDYHLKRLPIDQALQRLESRCHSPDKTKSTSRARWNRAAQTCLPRLSSGRRASGPCWRHKTPGTPIPYRVEERGYAGSTRRSRPWRQRLASCVDDGPASGRGSYEP